MTSKDDVLINEAEFSLNGTRYLARLYRHWGNGKTLIRGEIVYAKNNRQATNMKGVAREFLRQYKIDVSTNANKIRLLTS